MAIRRAASGFALLALCACTALQPKPSRGPEPGFDAAESGAVRTFLALSATREERTDLAGALAAADKALAQQPRSRAAALRRAELLLALDRREGTDARREEARAIIARAAQADDPTSLPAQARLAWNEARLDDAATLLRRAADAQPPSSHPQRLLAELLLEQGDAAGALAAAERALEVEPLSISARRVRARARLARGDAPGAGDDARAVLRASPDEVDARVLLADALDQQGRLEESIAALEALPARQRTTAIRLALARRELAAGRTDRARPLLLEALAAAPADPGALEALLALDLAAPTEERGARLGESLERLDAAAAAHPRDASIARVRGAALDAAGRRDEAEASFALAVGLDPDDLSNYGPLAGALLAKRTGEQAAARAAELGLGPGPTHQLIGAIREAQGDRARSLDAYEAALHDDPSPIASRIALALVLAAGGKPNQLERAAALAREAHAARPRDPQAAEALGVVLLASGKPGDAIDPLRTALGAWPAGTDTGQVRYHLALAYERTGQRASAHAQAQAAAASAARIKPEPGWAREARELAARLAPKSEKRSSVPRTASTATRADDAASGIDAASGTDAMKTPSPAATPETSPPPPTPPPPVPSKPAAQTP